MNMNKKITMGLMLAGSSALMGVAMPSCPGQQETEKRLELIQTKQAELSKQMQGLDTQLKNLNTEVQNQKNLNTQITGAINAQQQALAKIDEAMKAKPAPAAKAPKGAAKGAKKKH